MGRHSNTLLNFYSKIEITPDCWLWTDTLFEGYGHYRHNWKYMAAHRFAYEIAVGDLIPGMTIDHTCYNRRCVRPSHLEQVTFAENNRRSYGQATLNLTKTHCAAGHLFDEKNTARAQNGGRRCRKCSAEYQRKRRAEKLIKGEI